MKEVRRPIAATTGQGAAAVLLDFTVVGIHR